VIERKPFGKRSNIWRINPQQKSEHPAPFPEQLARDHILSWSSPGDLVLDPFVGSGTTGKMALATGRSFVGIDISDEYLEIARQRIASAANDNQPQLAQSA
jgi:site-specific DNA-methyltransferase (adenine-specific)